MKVLKKTLRDRNAWVLSRIMTPLFQGFDAENGDMVVLKLEKHRFIDKHESRKLLKDDSSKSTYTDGKCIEAFEYVWNPEDNTDYMLRTTTVKQLDDETMELRTIYEDVEEIDLTEFFKHRTHAGGWTLGRAARNVDKPRPPVAVQRLMPNAEPDFVPAKRGPKKKCQ